MTIKGSVVDSASGERIPYATVSIVGTSIGTVADINGYFFLRNVKPEQTRLRASAIGYRSKDFELPDSLKESTTVRLAIPESPKTMPAVEVTGESYVGGAKVAGTTIITSGELQRNVGMFKNDVVQYVTQLPGVVTVSGISSQYYVRGGGPDQNLVLIDGMQIYNLSHAFGLFSFVDPMIVKVADFSTGGFQAQYGGRLSSVFDIQTIDGDRYNYRAKGTLDLLSSDFSLTGPFSSGGNTSFVLFYRRPLFQDALQKFYGLGLPFDFYDGFAKATVESFGTGHVSAEFLTNADMISGSNSSEPDFRWTNNSAAVSGSYLVGDQYDMRFSISTSTYKAEQLPKDAQYLSYQLSEVSSPSLYAEVTSYSIARNEFNIGLLFNFPTYNYTFTNKYGTVIQQSLSETEPQVWAKYNFHFAGGLSFELGLRSDLQRAFEDLAGEPNGYIAEPRITLGYDFGEPVSVYATCGIYHQRLMNLNDENMVFTPFNVIAPLPEGSGDEQSTQYVLGVKLNPNVLTSARIEVYYKDFRNLVAVNRDKVYEYENDFIFGRGEAYGADVSFRYDAGESSYLEGSYSFSRTTRMFDGLTYFPRYDLRHQLNISAGMQLLRKFWLRARWKFSGGLPYTPVDGYFGLAQINPHNLPDYTGQALSSQVLFGSLNTSRLPGYQSLDLSASYDFEIDPAHFTLQGTLVNAYNKRNVFYINNITGDVVYQLPTIFNLSLSWGI